MPDRRTELRAAAKQRARRRREIPRPVRECEDCGTAITTEDRAYDAVLCWECLRLLNRGHGHRLRTVSDRKRPGAA